MLSVTTAADSSTAEASSAKDTPTPTTVSPEADTATNTAIDANFENENESETHYDDKLDAADDVGSFSDGYWVIVSGAVLLFVCGFLAYSASRSLIPAMELDEDHSLLSDILLNPGLIATALKKNTPGHRDMNDRRVAVMVPAVGESSSELSSICVEINEMPQPQMIVEIQA